ncbi:uncharacterized protein EI90DRAFT_3145699 [Cantharellus anzutake]|uniref:uncharacterized protein n=1 Tax=Cantharellus anzutake TaxID=1750568 RepID=UPI0019088E4B|nr:uncharacterized protein EI90DRAFT_3145699 [Cantharellus anzutake]KAF8330781.1 hypothetical protein EI90DRAFT_3145699 [Cantharellus anzutake]
MGQSICLRIRRIKVKPVAVTSWLKNSSPNETVSIVRRVKLKHPITQLMEKADIVYRRKLGSQSRTLRQAVSQYKKRYRRLPPKGFDAWWEFAKSNDFKMVDEFDSLMSDLEPFWLLSPHELRERARQVGELPSIDLVSIVNGEGFEGEDRPPADRAIGFFTMIEPFIELLPDMQFPISIKSEGRVIVPWEQSLQPNATVLSSDGEGLLGGSFTEDWKGEGTVWDAFRRACPPDSPARRLFSSVRGQAHTSQSSFNLLFNKGSTPTIHPSSLGLVGFQRFVDFCKEPSGRILQGHFFSDWRTLPSLFPVFSPAKAPGYSDIVIPSHYYYGATKRYTYGIDPVLFLMKETDNFEVNWGEKKDVIFWRGASTGGGSSPPGFLHQYHRHRLVQKASEHSTGNTTVLFPDPSTSTETSFISVAVPTAEINKEIFDIAFTKAIGCDLYVGGGCEQMMEDHRFANAVQLTDHYKYKYLIDLDGMGYSAHFLAFMGSESAVLKTTVYREFFSDWIQPWLHYIPVSDSYNDLYNIHAYFSGPSPSELKAFSLLGNHTNEFLAAHKREGDQKLRRIARAGRQWKNTITRRVDMQVYVYRLCIEWARLWSDNRDAYVFR